MQRLVMPFDDLAMIFSGQRLRDVHGPNFVAPAICSRWKSIVLATVLV
jgi:hypothetical protein